MAKFLQCSELVWNVSQYEQGAKILINLDNVVRVSPFADTRSYEPYTYEHTSFQLIDGDIVIVFEDFKSVSWALGNILTREMT